MTVGPRGRASDRRNGKTWVSKVARMLNGLLKSLEVVLSATGSQ